MPICHLCIYFDKAFVQILLTVNWVVKNLNLFYYNKTLYVEGYDEQYSSLIKYQSATKIRWAKDR